MWHGTRLQVAPAARQLAGIYHERVPIAPQRAGGDRDYGGGYSANTPGNLDPE
jgi:hypothetical protein